LLWTKNLRPKLLSLPSTGSISIPFGLQTSPGAFQRTMNTVLAGLNWIHCMVYLDDVLIFSPTFKEHLGMLDQVLTRLINANLKIKLKKCEFARTELNYLGHTLNSIGRRPDAEKVAAVKLLPPPVDVKQIEIFIGKVGYYQKFVEGFSALAHPLNKLRRKDVPWTWGPDQQESFETLRDALCTAPVLRHPDFHRKFFIQTDASGHGIGAVLAQEFEDGEHPIAYASRTLMDREMRYSATEREALALFWGINHFRQYLIGVEFKAFTDHRPLQSLTQIRHDNTRLERYALYLQDYKFKIEYKP